MTIDLVNDREENRRSTKDHTQKLTNSYSCCQNISLNQNKMHMNNEFAYINVHIDQVNNCFGLVLSYYLHTLTHNSHRYLKNGRKLKNIAWNV